MFSGRFKFHESSTTPVGVQKPVGPSGVAGPAPFPYAYDDYALFGVSSAWCLNQVSRGASSTQRTGRRMEMVSLRMRGVAYADKDWGASALSLVLIYDRTPKFNVALPDYTDIFGALDFAAQVNLDNQDRFRILHRFDFILTGGTRGLQYQTPAIAPGDFDVYDHTTRENSFVMFDEVINLLDLETVWISSNQDGLLDSMNRGSLLLYTLSSKVTHDADIINTDRNVFLRMSMRLCFKD